jgi:3-dehydrosphinganine reductase
VNNPGHALITGGSSGIGLAVAKRLAAAGWHLTLIARRPELLEQAAAGLRELGAGDVRHHAVDVSDRPAVADAMARVLTDSGAPDLVLTSAGIARPDHFDALADADFEQAMAINYFGTLHVLRALLPAMRARRKGHVVLMSSGAGLVGIYGYAAYAPTKFAVRGLAEVLRAELRDHGIGVSVVHPPDTDTPQLAAENLTKPAQTRAIAGTTEVMSADAVADAILAGVRRGRFVIAPGLAMGALSLLHSLLGPILRRHFDRLAAGTDKGRRLP